MHLIAQRLLLACLCSFALAVNTSASLENKFTSYLQDFYKIPAPGSEAPDRPGLLHEMDFYRWSYLVSPIVNRVPTKFSQDEAWEKLQAEVLSNNDWIKTDLDDPEIKAQFEVALKEALLHALRGSVAGPYQPFIWEWYRQENAYEKDYERIVADFIAKKDEWMAQYIARLKYDSDAQTQQANERSEGLLAWLTRRASRQLSSEESSEAVANAIWEWDHKDDIAKLAAQRESAVEDGSKALLADKSKASDTEWKEAETAYQKELSTLQESKFFRPEIYQKIQESATKHKAIDDENNKANRHLSDYAIYIDVATALYQKFIVENDAELSVQADSVVGFDAYSIIDSSIDSVLQAYLFRSGILTDLASRGLDLPKKVPLDDRFVYPDDDLYLYRREEALDYSQYWGPNAYFNRSIKATANMYLNFVENLSDAYAVIVRGNAKEGYDVVFQFLGKNCYLEEMKQVGKTTCESKTSSYFGILMLRPMGDKRTAYKLSGRYMGQTYSGMGSEIGMSKVGFDVVKFYQAQFDFNHITRNIDKALDTIHSAIQGAKEVIQVSSEDGYYLEKGKIIKLDAGAKPDPAMQFPIQLWQYYFLVDGKQLQIIPERGSMPYAGSGPPMQLLPISILDNK